MSVRCRESCPILIGHCQQLGKQITAERSDSTTQELMEKSASYIIELVDECPGPIEEARLFTLNILRIRRNIGLPSEELVIASQCRSPKLQS